MNDLLIFVPSNDHDDITLAMYQSGGYIPRPGDELIVELTTLKDTADSRAFDNAYFRVVSILPCLKNMEKAEEWMTDVWLHTPSTIYIRVEGTNGTTRAYIERLIAEYEQEQ